MPNHLANQTSPYLLQHQENPVDWYPWGPEAHQRARLEERPIFLSIGYSACHWCHVMEHESFENEELARFLNEHFISIKVDREERPDLDQIYMNAVQMMTGRGGWPMSLFLTPELKPFYGGTYWPPHADRGMPGFDQVLAGVADAWRNRRNQAVEMADQLTQKLGQFHHSPGGGKIASQLISAGGDHLHQTFDSNFGGFGSAPKFPHPIDLQLLLHIWQRRQDRTALAMVRTTLDRMAAGGIHDHLGGGFARYSVDAQWLVPHFEKMLYDNGLLAATYLEAYQATGEPLYAEVVRNTLDYVLREMTDVEGAFYSSEDADSQGEEGLYYTWTPAELRQVLDNDAAQLFARVYDVSSEGNFEGRSILHLSKPIAEWARQLGCEQKELEQQLAVSRAKLLAARGKRIPPGKDDKVLVAWNGLMIDAMARAGGALAEPRYVDAATKAADFLLARLRDPASGRLLHTWRSVGSQREDSNQGGPNRGQAKLAAYLDDYTFLAGALVSLYEQTFAPHYIEQAIGLAEEVLERFADTQSASRSGGGFFYTAADHERLIQRNKDFVDSSIPSGNAMAAMLLMRLGKLTGNQKYLDAAEWTIAQAVSLIERAPMATGQMLLAADFHLGPTPAMVLAGGSDSALNDSVLANLRQRFLPNKALAMPESADGTSVPLPLAPLLQGKVAIGDQPTLYICEGFTCREPAIGPAAISAALDRLALEEREE
jgi:uncharacterized protein